MRYGRKNLIFGFVYIIFTLALGVFISFKLKSNPEFAKEGFAFPRVIMRAAHAHGNLEAILNMIIGLLVDRLRTTDTMKQVISVSIILGTLLHSGILYILPLVPFAGKMTIIGAVLIIFTMVATAIAVIRGME